MQQTLRTIKADPRHSGIFMLVEEEIASRKFANWSMGFKALSKVELDVFPSSADFFKARQDEIAIRVRPSDALKILNSFAQGNMGIS